MWKISRELLEEKQQKRPRLCVLIVIMRMHLFSGDVEGDFLLEGVEDKQRTSRRETAEELSGLPLCSNCNSLLVLYYLTYTLTDSI